jgi:preprotein translocase subunit SecF
MKIKIIISLFSLIIATLISFESYGQQDSIDLKRLENATIDTVQKVDQTLHKKMMDEAKVQSDQAEEKAKEAKRIEKEASDAAEKSKKAVKAEKKAQRAREKANKEAIRAAKAREKSDRNQ